MAERFSKTMRDAIDYALKLSEGVPEKARLVRYPGGFWAREGWRLHDGNPWFGTTTIEAIVKRGAGEYTKWQHKRGCPENISTHCCAPFPTEVRITL